MEQVSEESKITLRAIFIDNGNWWKVFLGHRELIRPAILFQVVKMLACRTRLLGYHLYRCLCCRKERRVPNTCKCRFCTACGKKAADDWIKTQSKTLPACKWQHITFTLPDVLWAFFWTNRQFMNEMPRIAAGIILSQAKKRNFLPGIYLAIHTFGRDLKRNYHLHLSTTVGGLSLDNREWIDRAYFFHDTLKKMWKYQVLAFLRGQYKAGSLVLPPGLKTLKTYTAFNSWLDALYQKTWNVHLGDQTDNLEASVNYLGRYLKRPPISETRLKAYNGETVTYEYLDHYTQTTETATLPVLDFIQRLITHIPDANFRLIRYYGFLSHRLRGTLLPLTYKLLGMHAALTSTIKKVYTSWREMIIRHFKVDPVLCPRCKIPMKYIGRTPGIAFAESILSRHQELAHGFYPRL